MDIQYYGASCILITKNDQSILIDPTSPEVKLSTKPKSANIRAELVSDSAHKSGIESDMLTLDMPGEYEIGPFMIKALELSAINDTYATTKSIGYFISAGGVNSVAVFNHCSSKLSAESADIFAEARIVIAPAGGYGLSPDIHDLKALIKDLSPEVVIITHIDDGKTIYPSHQAGLDEIKKELGTEVEEVSSKFKFKSSDISSGATRFITIRP